MERATRQDFSFGLDQLGVILGPLLLEIAQAMDSKTDGFNPLLGEAGTLYTVV
jgi:hypothetical protein